MSKENSIDFKKLGEKLSDISKTFFDPNYSSLRYVVKVLREDAEGENKDDSLHNTLKKNLAEVEECVGEIVNSYYQPFNENVRSFSKISTDYTESKKTILSLREKVGECKKILEERRQNLKQLTFDRAKYNALGRILSKLELISTSEKELQSRLDNKRYYGAVKFYNEVKNELYSVLLGDISAIDELKISWPHKRESIEAKLIEELSSYIFLREGNLESLPDILSVTSIGILVESISESYEKKCIESLNPQSIDMVLFLIEAIHELGGTTNFLNHLQTIFHNELHTIVINELSTKKYDNEKYPDVYVSKLLPSGQDEGLSKSDFILTKIFSLFEKILRNVKFLLEVLSYLNNGEEENSFTIDMAWLEIQKEIEVFLNPLLKYVSADEYSTTQINKKISELNTISFSFVKTGEFMNMQAKDDTENYNTASEFETLYNQFGISHPFNLLSYYTTITQLCHNLILIISPTVNNDYDQFLSYALCSNDINTYYLIHFVKDFIEHTIVDRAKKDVKSKLDNILSNPKSFMIPHKEIGGNVPAMDGSQQVIDIMEKILFDALHLNTLSHLYIPVIDILLKTYLDKCNMKVTSYLKDSHIYKRYNSMASKYTYFYKSDPLYELMMGDCKAGIHHKEMSISYNLRRTSTSVSVLAERSNKEIDLDSDYYQFKPNPKIDKDSLLSTRVIEILCSFCESLLWISLRLTNDCQSKTSNEATTNNTSRYGRRRGSELTEQTQSISQVIQCIRSYSESYKANAERDIYYLRLEIKAHVMFYLSKMNETDYGSNDIVMGGLPDKYIIDLHKDILQFDDILHQQLTDVKKQFVLDGVIKMIPIMMIRAFISIHPKKIVPNGVDRLIRDLLAIQQTISSISDLNDGKEEIELLRQYFHLLQLSQTELLQFMRTHKTVYKRDEYDTIWNLETNIRPKSLRRDNDYQKIFPPKK